MTDNEKRMEVLTRIATVFTKLFEIAYHIGAVAMIVAFVLVLVDPVTPGKLVWDTDSMSKLTVQGFSMYVAGPDGATNYKALAVFLLGGAMILELMAWVFRDVNLILRTTQGLTKFSKGKTPFQNDNVRMMREIGFFFIAIAVVEIIFSTVAVYIVGPEFAEVSADMGNLVTGILMLCLSHFFAIGQKMQEDIDGLV